LEKKVYGGSRWFELRVVFFGYDLISEFGSQFSLILLSHQTSTLLSIITMPFKDESVKNYLPPSFMPTPFDVVCARGKEAFQHPGNKRYREIIDRNLSDYIEAENKIEKSAIVMKIVEEVRCDAPAGFVRYCDEESLWYEIGDEAASK
jgi:hypothetical protein